jgi:hypothetical protein
MAMASAFSGDFTWSSLSVAWGLCSSRKSSQDVNNVVALQQTRPTHNILNIFFIVNPEFLE